MPTVVELAMIKLAREWYQTVSQLPRNAFINRTTDEISYASLLLAFEWGSTFSSDVSKSIRANIRLATSKKYYGWVDTLAWELCLASMLKVPSRSKAVNHLLMNLDHSKSQVRLIMLELAWLVLPWLPSAHTRLLNNLAHWYGYSDLALALCQRLLPEGQFEAECRKFRAPGGRQSQYDRHLEDLLGGKLSEAYEYFWRLEVTCRKRICDVFFGFRGEIECT